MHNSERSKRYRYFGISGKGKSITLLGSLKYRANLYNVSTLYINCKTLKYLLKNKQILSLKQLLIDEIIYLTLGNFLKYKALIEYIIDFNFESEYDFWTLIENIITKFCNDNSPYVFGFDHYNDRNDYYDRLNKLKVYCNNMHNIKFVIFSSMNENDLRKIKILKLFEDNLDFTDEQYIELNNICDIKEISKSLDFLQIEIWEKFGYTMKSLMELKNSLNLQIYLQTKKIKLTTKLISFFAHEKEVDDYYNKYNGELYKIPLDVVNKILSFSTVLSYEREDILKVIDNIPFKYFNIIKINKDQYKINYGFPIIKDIMIYLYKFIMLKYNYKVFKSILKNGGSGLDTIFKIKVVFSLLHNNENPKIFHNFIINEHIIIDSISKRANETKIENIKQLKDNTNYIIEQENFDGKDLDFLIINITDSIPHFYGFHIYKYKSDIFKIPYLKNLLTNMFDNISQTFKIKIEKENTYFGYIFDYSRIAEQNYSSILDNCKKIIINFVFLRLKKKYFVIVKEEL